jgi:hypothetical protein
MSTNKQAGTSVVDVYAYEASPDQTVYLIDTPGFDDTNKSDTEVLGEIATWLGNSYKHKILLNGIIYLHRIIDVRVQGSARKNLMMFRQLCGADALKKVILVTTMWDKAPQEEGVRRKRELTQTPEYWGWMVQNGSAFYRHDHTRFSAERIVYRLANNNVPFATDLQKQLIDEQRTLAQTSAGLEISSDLLKEKQKWIREREELEKIMAAAKHEHDHETENFMREERDRTTRMIQKVEADQGALRSNMENLLAQRDARVAEIEKQLEVQKATHEDEVNRFKEQQIQLEKEKAELAGKMEKEESMLDQVQTRNFHQQRTSGLKTIGAMLDEEVGDKLFYSITLYNSKFAGSSRKQQAWCVGPVLRTVRRLLTSI